MTTGLTQVSRPSSPIHSQSFSGLSGACHLCPSWWYYGLVLFQRTLYYGQLPSPAVLLFCCRRHFLTFLISYLHASRSENRPRAPHTLPRFVGWSTCQKCLYSCASVSTNASSLDRRRQGKYPLLILPLLLLLLPLL
jgi:hypothetical protein